ncbi:hypothetical protein Tco_0363354 [Tanacetum coccineum]
MEILPESTSNSFAIGTNDGVAASFSRTSLNSDIKDPSSETKLRGRLLEIFQEDAKYEHVGQDTRSQNGKDDQDIQEKNLKISELKQSQKTMTKAQDQRSHSMKEQAYNKIQTKTKTQELNDKAISTSLRKLDSNTSHWGRFNYGVTCEDEAKRRNSGAKMKTFKENRYLLLYVVSSKEDTAYQCQLITRIRIMINSLYGVSLFTYTPYAQLVISQRYEANVVHDTDLAESKSPELDQISEIEEHIEEEVIEIMAEIMEQYMSKTRENYRSGVTRPTINQDTPFELKGQFLKELHKNIFSGSEHKDANEHIEKVLEIVDLFHISKVTQDQIMLRAFPISLTGAASRWLRNQPSGSITT